MLRAEGTTPFLRVRLPVNPGAVVPTSPPMTRAEVMSGEGLP